MNFILYGFFGDFDVYILYLDLISPLLLFLLNFFIVVFLGRRLREKKKKSDYPSKIVLIGDSSAGKSNILLKFTRN